MEIQKNAQMTTLTIVVLSIFLYMTLNHSTPSNQPISYAPDNTSIDVSMTLLKTMFITSALGSIVLYVLTRDVKDIFIPILIALFTYFANPFMHYLNEIDSHKYQNLKIILTAKPELISILPNYINAKCEMTTTNYEKFTALAQITHYSPFIKNLSQNKTENEVKKMCAPTIFRS